LSPNLLLNLLSFLVPSSLHQAKSKVSPARIVEISDIALSLVPPCQSSEDFVIEQGICYTEVHPRKLPLSPPQHSNKLFFTPLLQRRYCQRKTGLWVPHSCSTPSSSRINCTFSYTSSIKINIATRLASSMVIIFCQRIYHTG
jgi:hypothetical protein